MSDLITKKTLKYLTDLARIEIKTEKEKKLLKDLVKIIDYFEELKKADIKDIEPMAGGTVKNNVFRIDEEDDGLPFQETKKDKLIEQFFEEEDSFLKIPAVFDEKNKRN
ncbi:MAG: Asp-tRNA(Asn)/Glu-tRNA(Gln) amidotransferase subunit GatC [Candidatus Liptonbacteria bacterium]|nr:Asp-tRNA(Asn)/Glu-tRNA(Gln) amidotransferase subunit GatC [Candidatus Liptonbacteria bacterium]